MLLVGPPCMQGWGQVWVTLWLTLTLPIMANPGGPGLDADWSKLSDGYEEVVPIRLDSAGQVLADELHFRSDRRHRRSVDVTSVEHSNDDVEDEAENWTQVRYSLNAFGQDFDLKLTPNTDFISPSLRVQHMDVNHTWLADPAYDSKCYHSASIAGDHMSAGAFSVCYSLRGAFQAFDRHYFIEPHPEALNSKNTSKKLHIIYRSKKPLLPVQDSQCGISENYKHGRWKEKEENLGDIFNNIIKSSFHQSASPSLSSNASSASSVHHRLKRSMSSQTYVEVMVVADAKMKDYHGNNLQHYVLTLMSIVHSIYKHPSIGNAISVVVVKLLVLESEEAGPKISPNAATTLREFCLWQQTQNNLDDKSPQHHDSAVLLTRQDICRSASKCDTLGLAELGTICDNYRSCAINEDNGLSAAFTVAHEIGHLFNLRHDNDIKCRSHRKGSSGVYHVMAPTLDYKTHPWSWSSCSRRMLTEFLDLGYGQCLLDVPPTSAYEMIEEEPGEIFPVDKQCELVFGEGSKICPYMPACKRLWCTSPIGIANGCQTQHMPWADGTKCDRSKWCQQGECKVRTSKNEIDGQWGKWYPYGDCSRTCGGGIRKAFRLCEDPSPANGGKFCTGRRVKYRSCNTADCPASKNTFRETQCAKFNGQHFNINGLPPSIRWVPKYAGIHEKDRCKLYCRAATSSAYYLLRDKVEDGTKCGPETSDICVNGQCRRAGCDNRLGSKAKRDRCGVCGGDNSSCKTISNTFNHVRYGYNPVVRIPHGATNIDVRQGSQSNKKKDDNYLALKNSKGEFILNGNNIVTAFRKEIKIRGGMIEYSGSDTPIERINSTRMIQEDLEIFVLSVGKVYPPDIRYSYIISTQETVNYVWTNKGPWLPCSRTCQGFKQRKVVCVREDDGLTIVSDQRCEHQKKEKPAPILESCNTDCKLKWHIVEQTECSVRCGEGVIERRIRCQKHDSLAKTDYIDDSHCLKMASKPGGKVPCRGLCLPTHWKYNEWTQCSKTCGGGYQRRDAVCVDINDKPLDSSECNYSTTIIVQACNHEDCPMWKKGEWTGCSVTCGVGVRHRDVRCMKGEQRVSKLLCPRLQEPPSTVNCSLAACPQWFNGYWSECSVSCGVGVKTREVRCMSTGTLLIQTECNAALRPRPEISCHLPPCPTIPPSTTPSTTVTLVQKAAVLTQTDVTESNALQIIDERDDRNGHMYTRWRTGSWTECSTTCGIGRHERYVSCRDMGGDIADESKCTHLPKPASVEECKVRSCGQWRTGEWTECTVSCGEGKETRYVACITIDDLDEQITDHSECDFEVKPTHERLCNRHPCLSPETDITSISSNRVEGTSHWRVGPWGGCSSTCAGGFQRRRVVCQDENGMSDGCDPETIPPYIQSCNSGPCPVWNNGEWAACTVTCGGGIQERVVVCQLPSGQTLPNQSCEIMERPSSSRRCATFSCVEHSNVINPVVSESTPVTSPYLYNYYRWYRSPWSPYSVSRFFSSGPTTVVAKRNMMCSVTCGKGKKTRTVKCVNEKGEEVNEELCKKLKPKIIRRCRAGKCPRWIAKDWGECSVTCGKGIQNRNVDCMLKKGEAVNDTSCGNQTQPEKVQGCSRENCLRYNWVAGQWSGCSVTCGDGQRSRRVRCVDATTSLTVHYKQCDRTTRPKRTKRCSLTGCPYTWVTGEWAQCSKTCGEGQQERTLECKAMTREGWILPGQVDQCPEKKKPTQVQRCNLGHCRALYHWRTTGWGRCSAKCNQGKKRRRVHCVDVHGRRHSPRNCRSQYKPEVAVSCYEKPCYARSCKQLKRMTKIRRDGDYTLIIAGQPLQVYCSRMKKRKPLEFLSLPAGEGENYSEVFSKRLRNPYSCPGNGSRPKTCDCMNTPYARAGKSVFSKVRLNITSMRVVVNDFKYSRTKGAKRVAYSTAGDCFSAQDCPQGRFKINLSGTGLRVSEATKWGEYGHKASSHIRFSENGQVVYGECGGYCGHCAPLEHIGLQVEVLH